MKRKHSKDARCTTRASHVKWKEFASKRYDRHETTGQGAPHSLSSPSLPSSCCTEAALHCSVLHRVPYLRKWLLRREHFTQWGKPRHLPISFFREIQRPALRSCMLQVTITNSSNFGEKTKNKRGAAGGYSVIGFNY